MSGTFVHLHVHSEYSLVDSVVRIPELLAAVRAAGMPAVALTDQGNLFALVMFYKAALAAGVKPIVGADLWLRLADDGRPPARLVLLARNAAGYGNLARLVSRSYLEGQEAGLPVVHRRWLDDGAGAGLIALSGGPEGVLGAPLAAGRTEEAEAVVHDLRRAFPDGFYIELVATGRAGEEQHLVQAVHLAAATGTPVVATNDVRFLAAGDFEAHEARVCIQEGRVLNDPARVRRYSDQQYLRNPAEMRALFAALPEAIDNAVEIARRCSLVLDLGGAHMPELAVPDGLSVSEFLLHQARAGLAARLAQAGPPDAAAQAPYLARLEEELTVICRMGFAGYFLIVADFIQWSKANGIPVGPGRGSGAGSLVAWALGITELDPIAHSLLFERFLNPERVSMPDFDIDFCMEGRDRVIDYVASRYGRDRVSQIITYGTMAARAVVRDVGRVLGHPYGFTDRIAKLIPPEPKIKLADALASEAELRTLDEEDEEVRAVIDLARPLEGLVRNAGKHAGGVVIAPTRITDFAPLYRVEGETATVTQFDKDGLEAVGLVKFDFLGLRTLTIIDRAVKTINAARAAAGEQPIDIGTLPLEDKPTYELLRSGRTTAVFQLESRGMRDLIKRLKPDSFDDLVALVALFRPGPLQSGMVDDFIARKQGGAGAAIDYLHPDLEPVLRSTYGVIVYQEQVMQIAQVLAGYTLGGADLLRRAMGKKKPEEMAKQRSVFLEGAAARGVAAGLATRIFDLMEKFAEYGFNRSHSAAYALLAWQTAWLKARHPAAFLAAVLTCEMDDTDKLVLLRRECTAIGLELLPPDVNQSACDFTVAGPRAIRYGLGAIKGLGFAAADQICTARGSGGPYADLHDFCDRAGGQRLGRRAIEALIKAGALDGIGPNRASLMAAVGSALGGAEQAARSRDSGQEDMFGSAAAGRPAAVAVPVLDDWGTGRRLEAERESLGLYLSGHPFDQYRIDARFIASGSIADLLTARPPPPGTEFQATRDVAVAGLVTNLRRRAGRITAEIDDGTGIIEMSLFPETYERCRNHLGANAIVVVSGQLRWDSFIDGWRVAAREVADVDRVIEGRATRLLIRWVSGPGSRVDAGKLRRVLEPFRPGSCGIQVVYRRDDAQARFVLGEDWTVRPSRELRERLSELVGAEGFRFVYDIGQAVH
ncbi:MAG: DNA polymerase III subunit alpha [Gammaproteobacteria bacterium]|nr:DNA polymerase III subunit alpha [Gammaproteobacteria bacterium]